MVNVLIYAGLLAAGTVYAFRHGGGPERWAMGTILAGSVLTVAADRIDGAYFNGFAVGVFLVDLAVLGLLTGVALKADRYWPICVAALQTVTVMVHLGRMADVTIPAFGYAAGQAVWAYAMILLTAAGTWRHRRRRVRFGTDRSWRSFSRLSRPARHGPAPRG